MSPLDAVLKAYTFYTTHLTLPPGQELVSNTGANYLLAPIQYILGQTAVKKEGDQFVAIPSPQSLFKTTSKIVLLIASIYFLSRWIGSLFVAATALGTAARLYSYRSPKVQKALWGRQNPTPLPSKTPPQNSNVNHAIIEDVEDDSTAQDTQQENQTFNDFVRNSSLPPVDPATQAAIDSVRSLISSRFPDAKIVELVQQPDGTLKPVETSTIPSPQEAQEKRQRFATLSTYVKTFPLIGNLEPYKEQIEKLGAALTTFLDTPASSLLSTLPKQNTSPSSPELDLDAMLDAADEELLNEELQKTYFYHFALMKALDQQNPMPYLSTCETGKYQALFNRVWARLERLELTAQLEEVHPDTASNIEQEIDRLTLFFNYLLKPSSSSSSQCTPSSDEILAADGNWSEASQETQLLYAYYLLKSPYSEFISARKQQADKVQALEKALAQFEQTSPFSNLPLAQIKASVARFIDLRPRPAVEGFDFQVTEESCLKQISHSASSSDDNLMSFLTSAIQDPHVHQFKNLHMQLASDFFQDFLSLFSLDSLDKNHLTEWLTRQSRLKSYCFPFACTKQYQEMQQFMNGWGGTLLRNVPGVNVKSPSVPAGFLENYTTISAKLTQLGLADFLNEVPPLEKELHGPDEGPDEEKIYEVFCETINISTLLFQTILKAEPSEKLKEILPRSSQKMETLKNIFIDIELFDLRRKDPRFDSFCTQLGEEKIQDFLTQGKACSQKLKKIGFERYLPPAEEVAYFRSRLEQANQKVKEETCTLS